MCQRQSKVYSHQNDHGNVELGRHVGSHYTALRAQDLSDFCSNHNCLIFCIRLPIVEEI